MTDTTLDNIRNQSLTTSDATLTIEMGSEPLQVGQHSFALTVTDNSGNVSTAAQVSLIVRDDQRPTAVLDVRDAVTGRLIPNNTIGFGRSFQLSAARSTDVGGGSIVSYEWQLLD